MLSPALREAGLTESATGALSQTRHAGLELAGLLCGQHRGEASQSCLRGPCFILHPAVLHRAVQSILL